MGERLRILFATDLHGSEAVFRKFVNAGIQFKVDVLLLGGDLTGKALVPVVLHGDHYTAELVGREVMARTEAELAQLEKTIRLGGQYAFRCSEADYEALRSDRSRVDAEFMKAMRQTLKDWFDLARERLAGRGTRMLVIAGNDDPFDINEVIENHDFVECVDRRVVDLGNGIEVLGFGGSNHTPWNSPREYEECEITSIVESLASQLKDPAHSIWNVHVPPYQTGLDMAPQLTADLSVVMEGGQPHMIPVGSTAVLNLIEKYQPSASMHGHVHESRALVKIGKSVVLNPGSEYTEGVLRGAFVQVNSRGSQAQLMSG